MRIYFLKITIILLFLSSSLIAIEENSIKEVMSIKIDQVLKIISNKKTSETEFSPTIMM